LLLKLGGAALAGAAGDAVDGFMQWFLYEISCIMPPTY
jgi:hypothetical protein